MSRSASRERLVRDLEDWRLHHKAQWALTLSLGVSPIGHFDPDVSFKPHLRKLFNNVACEVFPISRRERKRLTPATCPIFFAGIHESHDRFGRPWPHIHGCIALGGQSEALLRGVLRDRWGEDEEPDKPGIISSDMVAVPAPSRRIASRAVVKKTAFRKALDPTTDSKGAEYRPSFCLRPIFSDHWLGEYATKRGPISNLSLWTAPEIMNLFSPKPLPLAA